MYAILEAGGRQWRVQPGARIDINRVTTEVGATHTFERVLLASDGQQLHVGRPYLEGARVVCEVVEHRLGPKTIAYHYRRRENWRRTVGHRQRLTRLMVKDVQVPGSPPAAAAAEPAATAPAKPAAPKRRIAPAASVGRPTPPRPRTVKPKPTKEPGHGA